MFIKMLNEIKKKTTPKIMQNVLKKYVFWPNVPPIMCFHPIKLTQENQNLNIQQKFKPSKFRILRCTFNIIKL